MGNAQFDAHCQLRIGGDLGCVEGTIGPERSTRKTNFLLAEQNYIARIFM